MVIEIRTLILTEGRVLTGKGHERNFRVIGMLYVLILLVITWEYVFVKTWVQLN